MWNFSQTLAVSKKRIRAKSVGYKKGETLVNWHCKDRRLKEFLNVIKEFLNVQIVFVKILKY